MFNNPIINCTLFGHRSQLRKMYRLLAGRHVPSAKDRWFSRTSLNESTVEQLADNSSVVSKSPSLNPSLVLLHKETSQPATVSSSPSTSGDVAIDQQSTANQPPPASSSIRMESVTRGLTGSSQPGDSYTVVSRIQTVTTCPGLQLTSGYRPADHAISSVTIEPQLRPATVPTNPHTDQSIEQVCFLQQWNQCL